MTSEVAVRQNTKRGASFSEIEQVSLAQSWIEVRLDPVHGNDQKGVEFFKKVSEIYKQKMGAQYTFRSPESLHAHWRDNIQFNVTRFSLAYKKATAKTISGYNPDDYIRDAQILFIAESKNKKPFKALKCWEILKSHDKWCPSHICESPAESVHVVPVFDRPIDCRTAKKAKIDATTTNEDFEKTKGELMQLMFAEICRNQELSTAKNWLLEKSVALKELKYFQSDTSEEGKAIFEHLRSKYINKYVTPALYTTTTTVTTTTPLERPAVANIPIAVIPDLVKS